MNFSELQLIQPILQALHDEGYQSPTPIQQEAIPIILQGTDLLGCAQTGTGKTAAFALPMLQLIHTTKPAKPSGIRALIVTPTRELAIQIGDSFNAYGRHLSLRNTVIFGGVGQQPQVNALKRGVDVLIATPGRLLDLIQQGFISLKHIEWFVLDEADRMLDMGFIHDVKKIIALLPQKRQSLFFSATMPPDIVKLSASILYKPQKVAVTPVSSTAEIIQQTLYPVAKEHKNALFLELLHERNMETVLVFTRTKHGADKLVKFLVRNDVKAEAIHGNKAQNARQRALTNFKNKTTRVLVATDIAARGIDVDELEWVVNYELPNIPETYVHRIGRTGRAGARGSAISFCNEEERPYVRDIEKLIGKRIPVESNHPWLLEENTSHAKHANRPNSPKSHHTSHHAPERKPHAHGSRKPNTHNTSKTPTTPSNQANTSRHSTPKSTAQPNGNSSTSSGDRNRNASSAPKNKSYKPYKHRPNSY